MSGPGSPACPLLLPSGESELLPNLASGQWSKDTWHDLAVPGSRRTNLKPCPKAGPAPGRCANQLVWCLPRVWAHSRQGSTHYRFVVAGLGKLEGLRAATYLPWVQIGCEPWGSHLPLWGIGHLSVSRSHRPLDKHGNPELRPWNPGASRRGVAPTGVGLLFYPSAPPVPESC